MESERRTVDVLGPVRVVGVDAHGETAAALLTSLALAAGAPRSVAALTEDVWGDDAPQNPRAALQTTVSRLRARAGADVIVSAPTGYRLGIGTDLGEVDDGVRAAEALAADDPARLALLDAALARWRGDPGADIPRAPVAAALAARSAAVRDRAVALRATVLMALGRTAEGAEAAAARAEAHPLDESAVAGLMAALAADGRPHEALAVFADFRTRLRDELGASPSAALDARHTEILRGGTDAPTRSRTGLRAAATPLLGRDADLAALAAALETERLVTILGAGGLGKTRLAQALAATSAAPAVAVVELAAVRDDADVPIAIAAGLGIPASAASRLSDAPAPPDVRERTLGRLAERTTLLVLDNCEQIAAGVAAWARDALAAVPSLRILATSRATLGIAGETVYPLAPLPSDDGEGPAVRLFVDRARALRPDALLPTDVVARLCERLDGLPLAIELAAARVRTMSPVQIEARLADRFALLTSGDRTAPERHRTLQAVIRWSWELLDADARLALAHLAVLPAGFTADSAAAVLARAEVDDVLDRLVSHSLLLVVDVPGGGVRFRMLETVREFALAELDRSGESEAARAAVSQWAREFALARTAALFRVGAYRDVADEHDNLVVLLRRALDDGDAATAVPLFAALAQVWIVRRVFEDLVAFAPPVLALLVPESGPAPWPAVRDRDEADAMIAALGFAGAGVLAAPDGGAERALRLLAIVRAVARRADPSPRWAVVAELIPAVLRHDGDARGEGERLMAHPDPDAALVARMALSQQRENEGDVAGAYDAALRAWAVAEHGAPWIAATAALNLGQLSSQVGRADEALRWFARADDFAVDFGGEDPWRQAWVRGGNLIAVGRIDEARLGYEGLLTTEFRSDDGLPLAAIGALGLAEVERAAGDRRAAGPRFDAALELFDDVRGRASPWYVVALAGLVAATTVDASLPAARRARWARRLRTRILALHRMRPAFIDRPVLGAAVLGWAVWAMDRDDLRAAGIELLALAETLGARQDLASLSLAEHREAAVVRVGAAVWESARAAAAERTVEERVARAIAILAGARLAESRIPIR